MKILAKIQAQVEQQRELFEAAIICLFCKGVFDEAAEEDSCEQCGERYDPKKDDGCPECGSSHFITHCPGCDETDPIYLLDVLANFDEYIEKDDRVEVLQNIRKFIIKRQKDAEQSFAADKKGAPRLVAN